MSIYGISFVLYETILHHDLKKKFKHRIYIFNLFGRIYCSEIEEYLFAY